MRIRLDINGTEIRTIEVINRGHPDCQDHEPHDDMSDLRLYEWRTAGLTGTLQHSRSDGAEMLAMLALASIVDAQAENQNR